MVDFISNNDIQYKQFTKFLLLAGIGWLLDMFIFSLLIKGNVRPLFANCFSASCGLFFSYTTTVNYIFYNNKQFLVVKFLTYAIINICVVLFFSNIIDSVAKSASLNPIIVKFFVTPVTLLMNFLILNLMNRFIGKDYV